MGKLFQIIIVILLATGAYVLYQNANKQQPASETVAAKDVIDYSQDTTASATKQTDEFAKQAKKEVRNVQKEFLSKADQAKAQVQELTANANALLDEGNYRQAMEAAQNILSNFDSESTEAKGIIAKAQAKIKEAAQTKLGTVKEDLASKIPNLGM